MLDLKHNYIFIKQKIILITSTIGIATSISKHCSTLHNLLSFGIEQKYDTDGSIISFSKFSSRLRYAELLLQIFMMMVYEALNTIKSFLN